MRDNVVIVHLRHLHHGFGDLAHIAHAKERIGQVADEVARHFHHAYIGVQQVDPALALEVCVDKIQRRSVKRSGTLSQNSGFLRRLRRGDQIEVLELNMSIARYIEQKAGQVRALQERVQLAHL